MVKFKLVYQDDRIILFRYFPEGNEDNYGVITVDKENETIEITKMAPDDFLREISADRQIVSYYYGNHAISKITEAMNNGEIPNSGYSDWY